MANILDICRYMEKLAPLQLAETWDNVGLLLGRTDSSVHRLMTCLTLTLPVAEEAIERKSQLIVTHHPILFRGAKKLTDLTEEGRLLLRLAESNVAVYSPHTAFDSAAEGINQRLAVSFGLHNIRPLRQFEEKDERGSGRFGILETVVEQEIFLRRVSHAVNASYLEFSWQSGQPVRKVAVACGSAGEFLEDAVRMGCDTFITGETRFHTVLECQAKGMNLILTGHFCSERPSLEQLAIRLAEHFPEIHCFASERDQNPLQLYCNDQHQSG